MPQDNPPLLDKTMNTTESTPRNLADVLASGLANIANNVKPDGSDISIDVPGMSANNANDGFSELKQSLTDLIKISTCTVMGNGTKYANNDVTAITGYTAIGIVGYDPSGSFVAGYELAGLSVNISAQKVYATWGVDLGSNAGIIAKVLYVRNGSAS